MHSIPQHGSLTAFKAALTAQFGPAIPVLYRVFFYRNGRYVELNHDDGRRLRPGGKRSWMITRGSGTVPSLDRRPANAPAKPTVIPLNPGFTHDLRAMTGARRRHGQITWAAVQVTSDPTDFVTFSSRALPAAAGDPHRLRWSLSAART